MGLYFNLLTSSVAPLAFFSLHAALQDNARKLLSEYVPLKQDVNRMRTDLLDLEKLPEISDEERDRLKTAECWRRTSPWWNRGLIPHESRTNRPRCRRCCNCPHPSPTPSSPWPDSTPPSSGPGGSENQDSRATTRSRRCRTLPRSAQTSATSSNPRP